MRWYTHLFFFFLHLLVRHRSLSHGFLTSFVRFLKDKMEGKVARLPWKPLVEVTIDWLQLDVTWQPLPLHSSWSFILSLPKPILILCFAIVAAAVILVCHPYDETSKHKAQHLQMPKWAKTQYSYWPSSLVLLCMLYMFYWFYVFYVYIF